MANISFSYADVKGNIKHKRILKTFIINLFNLEGKTLSQLDYVFCSDNYLIELNIQYLDHDTYTDIITFDLSADRNQVINGEIYISIERVKENAVKHGVSTSSELLRVIFHGALHLCGFKDKKKSEITFMREKEDCYLRLFEQQIKP